MLTPEEFRAWCQRLRLRPETEEIITSIRSSPPVRKVRGRAGNVTGRYPSPKMQVSIQFESQHVELWAIHHALHDKKLLPKEHLTDTNSAESKQFVASQLDYGIDLIAPTRADNKWQGQAKQGFAASSFQLDWQARKATCPSGHESSSWTPAIDRRDNEEIRDQVFDKGVPNLHLPLSVSSNRPTNHSSEERGPSCGLTEGESASTNASVSDTLSQTSRD